MEQKEHQNKLADDLRGLRGGGFYNVARVSKNIKRGEVVIGAKNFIRMEGSGGKGNKWVLVAKGKGVFYRRKNPWRLRALLKK